VPCSFDRTGRLYITRFYPKIRFGETGKGKKQKIMDVSVGAVGTAVIAGLVSVLGLIISKEQKVSEFRQAWIDELRKCLVSYLVNINAIVDAVRLKKVGNGNDTTDLATSYKALNEASHGITLRVNENEKPAKRLLKTMHEFEALAKDNANLTPENILAVETRFLNHSKRLLKFEWKRVKRGEKTFIWTKWIVVVITAVMIVYFVDLAFFPSHKDSVGAGRSSATTSQSH
jgi:hypothetical protein